MLGEFALDKAVEMARDYARKAEGYITEDLEFCISYLAVTRVAIQGLEEEYDQILAVAKSCDLQDATAAMDLQRRINTYLHVDRLRPELGRALAGLRATHSAMKEHADHFLQWPWAKPDRRAAVAEFATLLRDLEGYLRELDAMGLQYRAAGTGVGIKWLQEMGPFLSGNPLHPNPYAAWAELVDAALADRSKDNLLRYTTRIEMTIQMLRRAFR